MTDTITLPNISMYDSPAALPQGNGSAKNVAFENKAYFQVDDMSSEFHEMIITDISEQFSEGEARFNVLADGFVSFATGANPINVTIQGWVFINSENDHRLSFLKKYQEHFRGTKITELNGLVDDTVLLFIMKDTQFKLNLVSCQVKEDALMPDFTHISLVGVAYGYRADYIPVEVII